MAKLIQSVEFFVVGSPVQADRLCYVERAADQELIDSIVDQRFAYVLASRGSGKSSLMLRAIRTLRREAQQAALVDLNQINARGESSDASRWFYSVAHRIVRELRLKVDLQTWWQERSALGGEQRFADFFWDIVLESTDAPVTIFFDEIERAQELPFAADLFHVIRNCYALRVSEPDYGRLNFVVLGVASVAKLCPDPDGSPFLYGDAIGLPDLSIEQCYRLAPGFELEEQTAHGLLDRIYAWTSGKPYLTQKVARAVARRGGRLEDVERVVNELFLSDNAVREEPLISHIRALLTQAAPTTRPALQLLAKIAAGLSVTRDVGSPAQEALELAGVVVTDAQDALRIRNRIYSSIFTEKWARSAMPVNWRGRATAAAVLALAVVVPYWYMNHLPRPYIDTLSSSTSGYEESLAAYGKLHRLPGFGQMADDLFAAVVASRGRSVDSLAELEDVERVLDGLQGHAQLADQVRAEFWLRRARMAINREDRDAALIYAMEGLRAHPDPVRLLVRQLVGEDYLRLERSFQLGDAPKQWAADWSAHAIRLVDNALAVHVLQLDGARSAPPSTEGELLSALQPVPLIRELAVDSDGSAGEFDLQMVLDHPAPTELMATLTAPSGVSVRLALSDAYRTREGLTLTSRSELELGVLADEPRQGVWRLTLVDGRAGNPGVLHRWTLQFGDVAETWLGAPVLGTPIPDPQRTDQVEVQISTDSQTAVVWPSGSRDVGALALWELVPNPRLRADLQLEQGVDFVALTRTADRLLGVSGDALNIWDAQGGVLRARIPTQTGFVLPPALSSEGGYVAIAERVDGGMPLYSLIRTDDGALVASVEGREDVVSWVLGPEARYLALLTAGREITIMDPRRGAIIAQPQLERPAARVIPIPGEDLLLTIDTAGDVLGWRFAPMPDGLRVLENWRLGTTVDPSSVSVAMDASTAAFSTAAGNVAVHDLGRRSAPLLLRSERSDRPITSALSPDGASLLIHSGDQLRLWNIANRYAAPSGDAQLSALALGEQGRIAALGFRGGYVRVQGMNLIGQVAGTDPGVDFIGHRGPVSAIAVNTAQNQIATGGADGTVRLWNLASVSPTDPVMRHSDSSVATVAISPDGAWLGSGSEGSAQIWRSADGTNAVRVSVNGVARAIDFSPDGTLVAVGDSAGNLYVSDVEDRSSMTVFRAESAVVSAAFATRAPLVATGDEIGNVRVWEIANTSAPPLTLRFRQAVRWVKFETGDQYLLVQTDQWLHRLAVAAGGLSVQASRLLPVNLEPGASILDGQEPTIRLIGGVDGGRVGVAEITFSTDPVDEEATFDVAGFERDWQHILGYRLNAAGVAEPIVF